MSPLPPRPAPANIQINNGMPGTLAAGDGGGQVKAAGQCSVVIEGDADGVFSVASLETLAMMHPPDAPPGSGKGWQTVDSIDGAGPIGVPPAGFLVIRVQFACPASPAKETYTARAVAVLEGSLRLVLGVPITANVAPQQLTISVQEAPSTFSPGQKQDFVFLLDSSYWVGIEGAFGLQYINTPFDQVAITNSLPAILAADGIGITVSVECDPGTAAGDYELTFLYTAIGGPAPSQTFTAGVEVIVPTPPPPDPGMKDHFDAVWVSTQRICQLTGGGDPQGYPHPNDTTRFSLLGTDLGTSFDQVVNGEHRTYFFFGNTNTNDGDSDGDAIAYTTDDQPAPEGLHLQFIMGDEQWRRLIITGVSLEDGGGFNVPSGGFSYEGRIYVFATTRHVVVSGVNYMEESVLASAIDAHNDFDLAYYVSRRDDTVDTPATGGKFINVSPFVINNNDWPGLPDNAEVDGPGLLMAGSGAYRQSAPYLAYAPLPGEQGPAQSEWRYLQGFAPWEPGYGPSGRPIWSDQESDAMPIFDAQIGEISYSFHAGLGRWLLIYNGCAKAGCDIVLRSAPMPWGPWSEPQLIFNSSRECALGVYIFEDGPYGGYIISRYNSWDPVNRLATFHYTLSNGGPGSEPRYQVHQMRTTLRLINAP